MNKINITYSIKDNISIKLFLIRRMAKSYHRTRKFYYNHLLILFCIYIEKTHRKVFDNIYQKNYNIKLKDSYLLTKYKLLCKIAPGFRPYLKYWKAILERAYAQKRVNYINFYLYLKLKNINTDRYT